jgi:hypothetical protein
MRSASTIAESSHPEHQRTPRPPAQEEGSAEKMLSPPRRKSSSTADFVNSLEVLPAHNDGMKQTTYDQLCRLHHALEPGTIDASIQIFRNCDKFELNPGPLGNCSKA